MHDVHFEECLRAAAGAVGWEESSRGKGLCVLLKGMQTPSRASITIEAADDVSAAGLKHPSYIIRCATAEMGQGARRTIRMMTAELLGVDESRVRFPDPDTDLVPYDTRTTSSRSTHMMGRALVQAVRDLELNGRRGCGEVVDKGGLDPDTGQGIASSHWHQGAGAAHVEVDEETGTIEVKRVHAAIYAGHVVNRPGAELQNEGSMIMGLGTALFEGIVFDHGQTTNANFSDYCIPSAADIPPLTHDLIERPGADIHGLGETALPPIPAAIGNALYSLGIHVTDLPILPEQVLEAIDRRDEQSAHEQSALSTQHSALSSQQSEAEGRKLNADG
jgi:CO/xanthine dehydrogenase Mo-binding subunit